MERPECLPRQRGLYSRGQRRCLQEIYGSEIKFLEDFNLNIMDEDDRMLGRNMLNTFMVNEYGHEYGLRKPQFWRMCYTEDENRFLEDNYESEFRFMLQNRLAIENSDHRWRARDMLMEIMENDPGNDDYQSPEESDRPEFSAEFHLTHDQKVFLKQNYGSEFYFLRERGLKIYKSNDRWKGLDILESIMENERRSKAASRPQGVRKRGGGHR